MPGPFGIRDPGRFIVAAWLLDLTSGPAVLFVALAGRPAQSYRD